MKAETIDKLTYYTDNPDGKPDYNGDTYYKAQLTPGEYLRYNIKKYGKYKLTKDSRKEFFKGIDNQIFSEFLGHSDFNKLSDEKYIEIV